MTEKQINLCIKSMNEMCDKRSFSKTLDMAVGIIRHFEDVWLDLPDVAKRAFVIQYGEGVFNGDEKQNDSTTRDAE